MAKYLMVRNFTILVLIFGLNSNSGIFATTTPNRDKDIVVKIKPSERIFLQTDREVYIAGENLFYSLRLINLPCSETNPASKIIYLAIRNANNKVVLKAMSRITNGTSSGGIFLPDTLSSGLFQFIAYTNLMRNSDESFYFRKTIYVANRFDQKLIDFTKENDLQLRSNEAEMNDSNKQPFIGRMADSMTLNRRTSIWDTHNSQPIISTEKRHYNHREKIQPYLALNSAETDSIIHYSIAVAESSSLNPLFVSGKSESSNLYPMNVDTNHAETFIKLNNSFAYKVTEYDSIKYFPEFDGYILKGKVTSISRNEVVPGVYVLLSTPDTITDLDYSITNGSGQFYFLISNYYEGKKLILSLYSKTRKTSDAKIEVEDKYGFYQPFLSTEKKLNPKLKDYILKSQEKVWIQKVYEPCQKLNNQIPGNSSVIPVLYSIPQATIYPADYVEFQDFSEMAKNIIPGLRLRKEKDSYTISMLGMENDNSENTSPAIFLDGVLIDDVSKIINLGSEKIRKIELIKSAWFFGDIEFHGILSIFSKKYEIDNIQLQSTSIFINLANYAKNNVPIFPDYSELGILNEESPDFRQLLYWNPDLSLVPGEKKKIEFYSGDLSGKYLIKAVGITSKGKILESIYEIVVGSN